MKQGWQEKVVWTYALVVACLWMSATPLAQDETIEWRLEHVAGIVPDAASDFFSELRKNVGTDDRRAVCEMVSYPLSQPDGNITSAADCVARYDTIFTIAVRKAVGKQQYEELFVTPQGVVVGLGELWFSGSPTPRITVVNHGADLRPPKGRPLLVCTAAGQRIQVSADGNGGAEFRLWRSTRASGPPAVEVLRETPPEPGSARECGSRVWSFRDGETGYTVSELACDAYLRPPPMGSVGQVTRRKAGEAPEQVWCVE